jgi:hypothetical protein
MGATPRDRESAPLKNIHYLPAKALLGTPQVIHDACRISLLFS